MWIFLVAFLLAGLLAFYYVFIWPLFFHPLRHVPGPRLNKLSSINIAINNVLLRRNDKVFQWHRKYGPIVCISPNEVSVATIDATREIYGSYHRYDKSTYFDHFKGYDDRSIFATLSFEEHKRKRRLTSSFYQASTIYADPSIENAVRENVRSVLHHINITSQSSSSVDVYSLTDWYAFDNITLLVFGPAHCSQAIKGECQERRILKDLKFRQLWGPFSVCFPWAFQAISFALRNYSQNAGSFNVELELAKWSYDRLSQVVHDLDHNSYNCLVQRLLSQTKSLEKMEKERVINRSISPNFMAAEVLDNINAAEATVAVTATYAIYYLSRELKWQEKVRNELLQLPLRSDGLPSFSEVNRTPILEAFMKEVYRLKPAVSGRSERIVPGGGRILSGVYLPAKTIVSTSVITLHHDEDFFTNSNEFAPERWLNVHPDQLSALEARLIPFGYGARICLGKALATLEIKLLLAGIYLRYETTLSKSTTESTMRQTSTHDAVPQELKCDIQFRPLTLCN